MIGLKDEEWNMKKKLEEVVEKSNEQNKRTRKLRMEFRRQDSMKCNKKEKQ